MKKQSTKSKTKAAKAEKFRAEVEAINADMRLQIGDWEPPSNDRWVELMNPILPTLRMAWIMVMHKTSAEVAKIQKTMNETDPAAVAHLMRQLNWTGGYLEKLQDVCRVAEARLEAHGAPKAVQDWLHDAPFPPEPKQNWRAKPKLGVVKGGAS